MNRRTFLRGGVATIALAASSGAYANLVERHEVEVRHVPLALGLSTPLRLALLSDLHFDPLYETDYLHHVFQTTAAAKPDLICFTGNFLTHSLARIDDLARAFAMLRPPLGIYGVLGNHDHWTGAEKVTAALQSAGVEMLTNRAVRLPGQRRWQLGGMDSFWGGSPNGDFLANAPRGTRFILLVHEPDAFDVVADPRVRLQLSGHTHGGQVRAPLLGALQLPR